MSDSSTRASDHPLDTSRPSGRPEEEPPGTPSHEESPPAADPADAGDEERPHPDEAGESEESREVEEAGIQGEPEDTQPSQPPVAEARAAVYADRLEARSLDVSGLLKKYENCTFGSEQEVTRTLSREHFKALGREDLARLAAEIVTDEAEVGEVVATLRETRLFFLVGERQLGKGALACSVAARLVHRESDLAGTLVTAGVERSLRVDLDALIEEHGPFVGQVVVIEDAFDEGNQGLASFATQLDGSQRSLLRSRLEDAGSYLVLTSTPDRLPVGVEQLESLGLATSLTPPAPQFLRKSILQRAAKRRSEEGSEVASAEEVEALVADEKDRLVSRLRTVPRALRFVDSHLFRVVAGELSLEAALERLDDLEFWLLRELAEDLDAWSFTLALTLASSGSHSRWVPWLQLFKLWRVVRQALESELEGDRKKRTRSPESLLVDRRFLGRVRAMVARLPYPLGECVSFSDPTYPERLWEVLLGSGRALLALLHPRLRELAEGEDFALRELAARSLGRTGELDPNAVALPLLAAWTRKDAPRRFHLALGELLTGALRSEDPTYHRVCLHHLRRSLQRSSGPEVEAAIVSLSRLGQSELSVAMAELRRVAEKRLGHVVDDVQQLYRECITLEGQLDMREDRLHEKLLALLADALFDDFQLSVLQAVQYSLIGLCFARGPLHVFEEVLGWMDPGEGSSDGLAAMVVVLFLKPNGILEVLERNRIAVEDPGDGSEHPSLPDSVSRIVVDGASREGMVALATFVEALYSRATDFPPLFRHQFQEKLLSLITRWGEQAPVSEEIRSRLVCLLGALLDSADEPLRKSVFHLLQHAPAFSEGAAEGTITLGQEVLLQGSGASTR